MRFPFSVSLRPYSDNELKWNYNENLHIVLQFLKDLIEIFNLA